MFTFHDKNHNDITFEYIDIYYDEEKPTEHLTFQSTILLILSLGMVKYATLMHYLEETFFSLETGKCKFNNYSVFFTDSILLSSSCSKLLLSEVSKRIDSMRKRKENLKFSTLCSDFTIYCDSNIFRISYEKDSTEGNNKLLLLVYDDHLIAYENNEQTHYQEIGKREVTIRREYDTSKK